MKVSDKRLMVLNIYSNNVFDKHPYQEHLLFGR